MVSASCSHVGGIATICGSKPPIVCVSHDACDWPRRPLAD
jgi:hypothetical protein